jgi:hypothetical protein
MIFNLRTMSSIAVLASSLLFTGCAAVVAGAANIASSGTDDSVAERTIKYFGLTAKEVSVYDIERGALSTSYKAKVSGKIFNCTIYYGDVGCRQPGG